MVWDVYSGGSSRLPSLMPLVLLGYVHVACTFEDVLLSIRSLTTDMGNEAGIPSIDNVLSHFGAVIKRSVSGTFQAYSRLLPRRCVHVHDWHHFWAGVIKCVFEAYDCWPSKRKKVRDICTFFRCGDYRDVCSSYSASNGKSTDVLETFTASLAQWPFDIIMCGLSAVVQASSLYAERFLSGDVCHVEG